MTNQPTFNPTFSGQMISLAERATRARIDDMLADMGTSFLSWVSVNAVNEAGGSLPRAQLVALLRHKLKVDAPSIEATVDALLADGALRYRSDDSSTVELTDSGTHLYQRIRAGSDVISTRLYAGLSADELAAAAHVLTTLTQRANAELDQRAESQSK